MSFLAKDIFTRGLKQRLKGTSKHRKFLREVVFSLPRHKVTLTIYGDTCEDT